MKILKNKKLKYDVKVFNKDGKELKSRPITFTYNEQMEKRLMEFHGKDLEEVVAEMILENINLT